MVTRGDRTLTVRWNQPAKKGSDIVSYTVKSTDTTTGATKQVKTSAGTLQATLTGLTNNHVQQVSVRATNSLGPGPFGPVVQMQSAGTPPAVGRPDVQPRPPAAGYDSTNVQVTWNAVSPNGPALVRYTVYRQVGGGGWTEIGRVSPGTTRYTDSGVVYDGRTYTYVVTATNGASKESAKTNTSSFSSVGIPQAPAQPRAATPSANNGATITVALGSSRSAGFTRLEWRSSGSSGFVDCPCANGSSRQFTISGTGNTAQSIRVRAFNGTAWSAFSSASSSFTPYGPTKTPTNLRHSRSGKTITWQWSTPDNGRPTDQVQVRGAVDRTFSGDRQSVSFTGAAGRSYSLAVRAHTVAGWSAWTSADSAAIPSDPTVTVLKGSTCGERSCATGNGSCSSPSCRWIAVRTANFSGGVTCTFRANGRTVSGWRNLSMGGNAYKESDNFYGIPGGTVSATCGGVTDTLSW